jgi:multisubunit Na+/H+ antiporter MnhF subunit
MIEMIVAIGALVVGAMMCGRLFGGPTFYDRALAAFSANAMLGLGVAAVGALTGRLALVDLAIAQTAVGFVLAVAVLKVLRLRTLQPPLATAPQAPSAREDPAS